ncbi:MAG: Replicative DNA helicase [Verrucomicrobia bacterium ADurb.Bin122]|nr:MAG: Replicative DNA helicase [Verrucomicrobia bacterium ADurb.Bin122]
MLEAAHAEAADPNTETMDHARNVVAAMSAFALADTKSRPVSMSEAVASWAKGLDNPELLRVVPSGFYDFDDALGGGFRPGTLNLLAGRPGHGKTTMALNIIANAAERGFKSLFFSLEMPRQEVVTKMIASRARVDISNITIKRAKDDVLAKVAAAAGAFRELPITIDDAASLGVVDIAARAAQTQTAGGLDVVIVDYLQLITMERAKGDTKDEAVGRVTKALKAIAKDLRIPVVALSQLNREGDTDDPQLSHLRDSGNLEQDADTVTFIRRKDKQADIMVKKNRMGRTAAFSLRFVAQHHRMDSVSYEA